MRGPDFRSRHTTVRPLVGGKASTTDKTRTIVFCGQGRFANSLMATAEYSEFIDSQKYLHNNTLPGLSRQYRINLQDCEGTRLPIFRPPGISDSCSTNPFLEDKCLYLINVTRVEVLSLAGTIRRISSFNSKYTGMTRLNELCTESTPARFRSSSAYSCCPRNTLVFRAFERPRVSAVALLALVVREPLRQKSVKNPRTKDPLPGNTLA